MIKWKIGVALVLILTIFNTASAGHQIELEGNYPVEGRVIEVSDNYAYILGDKLYVIDISTPSRPMMVGQCEVSGEDIAISGSYAYVIGDKLHNIGITYDPGDGMHVIAIRDPYNPVKLGHCNISGRCIAVSGNHAYIGTGSYMYDEHSRIPGLGVVDISDPYNLIEIHARKGEYEERIAASEIVASGDYIYVADESIDGLVIIDVSDPANPIKISKIHEIGYANDVAVSGQYAYRVGGGLYVVDVSDPRKPKLVGETFSYDDWGVAVDHKYAYIRCERDFINIYDISDPWNPRRIGFSGGGRYASDVAASSNYAYLVGDNLDIYTVIETGYFEITSSPSHANIYIDGEYIETTTSYANEVPVGYHTIKLTKSGYNDWETTKYVEADEQVDVSATLTSQSGSISIASAPVDAKIYLDGIYEGITPKTISGVSIGYHTIELNKEGYPSWSTSLYVTAGDTETISASMNAISIATPTSISIKSPTPISTPAFISTPTPIPVLVDSDGDGVPNKYDYAPYNPNIQTERDIIPEATPTPKPPGFDVMLTISGILAIAYLLRRRR